MMKLATVDTWYGERLVVEISGMLVDLSAAFTYYLRHGKAMGWGASRLHTLNTVSNDMIDFLSKGKSASEAATETVEFLLALVESGGEIPHSIAFDPKQVQFRPPVPRPPKIWGMRGNFPGHVKEMAERFNRPVETPRPSGFLKAPTSVIGHEEPIILPRQSQFVEHELELAVIIKKRGSRIPEDEASSYVGGYTIFIDVSARDVALRDDLWVDRSKSYNTFGPTGPYLLLNSGLEHHPRFAMELRVDGDVRQKANTDEMIFKVPFLVSWVSQFMTLEPGDLICTGTCEGVERIRPGDVIEAEIENIGTLRNRVIAEE